MDATDYAANAPQGYMGDWTRGAPLGRPSLVPQDAAGMQVRVRRVPIDEFGYDGEGTYFGFGEPVWWAATDDGALDATFRAWDVSAASAHIRSLVADAVVDVGGTVGSARTAAAGADPAFAAYLAAMLSDAGRHEEEEARSESRETREVGSVETMPQDVYEASLADWRRFADGNAADIAAACALVPGEEGFSFADGAMTPERIGATAWLVRTGSGIGFTDDGDAECLRRLDAAAEALGQVDAYLGDDDMLHLS